MEALFHILVHRMLALRCQKSFFNVGKYLMNLMVLTWVDNLDVATLSLSHPPTRLRYHKQSHTTMIASMIRKPCMRPCKNFDYLLFFNAA